MRWSTSCSGKATRRRKRNSTRGEIPSSWLYHSRRCRLYSGLPKRQEEKMRSNEIKKGAVRAPNRCLLYATGLSPREIGKPFIGIASSFSDLVPGHVNMRDLERYIERGVAAGGGNPFIFGLPAICDG